MSNIREVKEKIVLDLETTASKPFTFLMSTCSEYNKWDG